MSKRNIADEWKLEGANQPQQQWVLQEAEQKSLGPWQLQDQPQVAIEWQPVDYVRDRRGGGANWILPTFVGVALVAVLAYAGWILLNRTGVLGTIPATAEEPAATATAPAGAPTVAPTPTTAPPTPTPPPPTPTLPPPTPTLAPPTPTPILMVDLASAIITADNGVNARREASLTGEVIRVVNKDETFLIAAEQPEWVQVALSPNELAWVTAEFVQKTSERLKIEDANQRRAAVGLPPLAGSATLSSTLPLTATARITAPATLTATTGVTGSVIATTTPPLATSGASTVTAAATLEATIAITSGLNARSSPDLSANNVIRLLAYNEKHTAIARSPDSKWVQLRLQEDNRLAWVAAEYVTLNGAVNSLPAAQPTSAGPVAPISSTNSLTATQTITGVTSVVTNITVTISNLAGANARPAPSADAAPLLTLPFDSVLPVVGRSADSQWLKVTLEESQLAWVLASEVTISSEIAALPVVQ